MAGAAVSPYSVRTRPVIVPVAWVVRYWYGHCQSTATGEHVTLPSARHHDKAQAVQKTVTGACNGSPDVEPSRQQPIAAIGNIEQHHMITFTEVRWH